MSITTHDTVTVTELADRLAIADVLHRWGAALDEQDFDALLTTFAADATVTTPGGQSTGAEAIRAQAVANHIPEVRTQHRMSDLILDLDGDRASARANYVGVFAKGEGKFAPPSVFQIGSVCRFELVRIAGSWQVASFTMHPVWADGERPY